MYHAKDPRFILLNAVDDHVLAYSKAPVTRAEILISGPADARESA
jgi:hypothetical protein